MKHLEELQQKVMKISCKTESRIRAPEREVHAHATWANSGQGTYRRDPYTDIHIFRSKV